VTGAGAGAAADVAGAVELGSGGYDPVPLGGGALAALGGAVPLLEDVCAAAVVFAPV
jgi:hypothetical protein